MPTPAPFATRTALITGAASGIGRATAELLATRGAALILVDRDPNALATLLPDHPTITRLIGDVADEAFWIDAAPTLAPLDLALVNAGISGAGTIAELEYSEWRRILAVNLDGAFLTMRAAMRALLAHGRGGAIVATSSISGVKAEPGTAAYGASKAALLQLCKVAAKEGAPHNIRVNAIAPGGVDTPIWDTMPFFTQMVADLGSRDAAIQAMAKMATPLGKYASASEIAAQIVFLFSDDASTITGATLIADGGYSL